MRKIFRLIIFFAAFCFMTTAQAYVYSTWDVLEVDTCASAWLIKRFVDRDASFKIFPRGEIIAEGIAFDTPDAEFRRSGNMSTFESIAKRYAIEDPGIKAIGEIIHDIEINYWGKKEKAESLELNETIQSILKEDEDKQKLLINSFSVFDRLYEKLKGGVP